MYELEWVLLYLHQGNDLSVSHTDKSWKNMRSKSSINHIIIIGLTMWERKKLEKENDCEISSML
jgi:hypothetical protein